MTPHEWKLPAVDAGGIRVPLERLREISATAESARSLLQNGVTGVATVDTADLEGLGFAKAGNPPAE